MEDEKKFEKVDKFEEKRSDRKSDKHSEKKKVDDSPVVEKVFTVGEPATRVFHDAIPKSLDLDKLSDLVNDTSYGVKVARLIKGFGAGNIPLDIFVGDLLLLASKMESAGLGPFEDAKKYLNSLI